MRGTVASTRAKVVVQRASHVDVGRLWRMQQVWGQRQWHREAHLVRQHTRRRGRQGRAEQVWRTHRRLQVWLQVRQ